MKNSNNGTSAQGATVPTMTPEQFRKALEDDLNMLHALLNFIRSTPRVMDAMSEVAYETAQNSEAVQKAQIALAREHQS